MITRRVVKQAAQGRWVEVLSGLGVSAELLRNTHGPCPGCGGRDRFRFDDLGGDGTFLCSGGGSELAVGDGFKLVEHVRGCDWKEASRLVAERLGLDLHDPRWEQEPESLEEAPTAAPQAEKPKRELDRAKVADFIRGVPEISDDFLRRRSPVDPVGVRSMQFLEHLFKPEERALVFTEQWSQGDFLGWMGHGSFRLSRDRGVPAVRSPFPRGGKKGVWYLVQPVEGTWAINQKQGRGDEPAKYTRRSEVNVTAWRHFVLESDVEDFEDDWRRVVANLRLPIAAIYTSGGRSVHALMQEEIGSKPMWDTVREALAALVCPLGADPGALSAVRLSRLPGCLREGKDEKSTGAEGAKRTRYVRYPKPREQQLLYLNPKPTHEEIWMMKEVRE